MRALRVGGCARRAGRKYGTACARGIVPCGHGGFVSISFGLPPARADEGLSGGCRPSAAPSALPRTTPRGFPYAVIPRVRLRTLPDTSVGLSNYHTPARAARLGLRELPSLRSGDLPARRAMPAFAFTLYENWKSQVVRAGCHGVITYASFTSPPCAPTRAVPEPDQPAR